MTFDVYDKYTDDLLTSVAFLASSGWTNYWDNVGALSNKGIEFSINADLFPKSSEFQWNIGFNIASNKNRVEKLYNDTPMNGGAITVGRDVNTWYLRKWAGVDPTTGNPLWEHVDPKTGEITAKSDYNNATLQYLGSYNPKYSGGFNTSMSYKGFVLAADFVYSKGGLAYNSGREFFDADGAYPYYNQMVMQDGWSRWTTENPNATHPKLVYNNPSNSNKTSSRYLEDASFLRMRNIRLAYNFDQKNIQSLGLKGLTLYVAGDNLWTSTKYTGADVEAVISGDTTSNYPNPKRYTFGVNLNF